MRSAGNLLGGKPPFWFLGFRFPLVIIFVIKCYTKSTDRIIVWVETFLQWPDVYFSDLGMRVGVSNRL